MGSQTFRAMLVVGIAILPSCRRAPAPAPAPASTAGQSPVDDGAAERARLDSVARAERARADSIALAEALRKSQADAAAALLTLERAVYFDFDSDDIRSDAAQSLDAKAPVMRLYPAVRVRITGHTDDRGSDEYNLALGQRRAAAVRRYLIARGVEDPRIEAVSMGEQRPACTMGGNESCWQQNRRAEFVLTAGAETITVSSRQ